MRKTLLIIVLIVACASCGAIHTIPIETTTEVHYIDSIRYQIRDSIRITEATRYKDMAWLGDSLKIQGSRSRCWAVADTARGAIVGGLEEDRVEEKTRIVYRDRWKVRDSLVFRDVPIEIEKPVEVIKIPWIFKVLSGIGLLSIIGIALWVFLKFKGFGILK